MAAIRVMLADDHRLFRAGVRALLEPWPDLDIVGEAADGREVHLRAASLRPDVILMDLMMPNLNGVDATARVLSVVPRAQVLILSMSADRDCVLRALRAGAAGYLVKASDPAELELAIRAVARGERFLSSAISAHVIGACLRQLGNERTSLERLTCRQREVLQMVAEGHSTKEIAAALEISTKTAETYRAELIRALDIHDIASLTRYAIRAGLVSAES